MELKTQNYVRKVPITAFFGHQASVSILDYVKIFTENLKKVLSE